MLKLFTKTCVVLMLLVVVSNQASADFFLTLRARGPGGSNNLALNPGQSVQLTISLEALTGPLNFAGGDFDINAGGASVLNATQYLLSGPGNWLPSPPAGGSTRAFTGTTSGTFTFAGAGSVLNLGTIVLQASNVQGTYNTSFTGVFQVDDSYLPISTTTSNFQYSVVPEPSSAMLLGLAVSTLSLRRRR